MWISILIFVLLGLRWGTKRVIRSHHLTKEVNTMAKRKRTKKTSNGRQILYRKIKIHQHKLQLKNRKWIHVPRKGKQFRELQLKKTEVNSCSLKGKQFRELQLKNGGEFMCPEKVNSSAKDKKFVLLLRLIIISTFLFRYFRSIYHVQM